MPLFQRSKTKRVKGAVRKVRGKGWATVGTTVAAAISFTLLSVFLLSGDVESNPGPCQCAIRAAEESAASMVCHLIAWRHAHGLSPTRNVHVTCISI